MKNHSGLHISIFLCASIYILSSYREIYSLPLFQRIFFFFFKWVDENKRCEIQFYPVLCLLVRAGVMRSFFICLAERRAVPHACWANALLQNSIHLSWRVSSSSVIVLPSWVPWSEAQVKDKHGLLCGTLDPLPYLSHMLDNFSNLSPHCGPHSYLYH